MINLSELTEGQFYEFIAANQDRITVKTAERLAAELGFAFYPEMVP
jgi:hypothetical protein